MAPDADWASVREQRSSSNTLNLPRRSQSSQARALQGGWDSGQGAGPAPSGKRRFWLRFGPFGATSVVPPTEAPGGGNSGGQPPPRQHYLLAISEQQIHASCGPTTPWMARRPSAGLGPVRSGSRGPLWTRPPSCPCHSMGSTQLHACLAGPCWPSLGRRRGTPHRCAADTLNPVQRSGERFVL